MFYYATNHWADERGAKSCTLMTFLRICQMSLNFAISWMLNLVFFFFFYTSDMLQIDINAGATPKEVGGILSNNGIFVDFQCLRIRIGQLQYVTCLVLNHSYTLVI